MVTTWPCYRIAKDKSINLGCMLMSWNTNEAEGTYITGGHLHNLTTHETYEDTGTRNVWEVV